MLHALRKFGIVSVALGYLTIFAGLLEGRIAIKRLSFPDGFSGGTAVHQGELTSLKKNHGRLYDFLYVAHLNFAVANTLNTLRIKDKV